MTPQSKLCVATRSASMDGMSGPLPLSETCGAWALAPQAAIGDVKCLSSLRASEISLDCQPARKGVSTTRAPQPQAGASRIAWGEQHHGRAQQLAEIAQRDV